MRGSARELISSASSHLAGTSFKTSQLQPLLDLLHLVPEPFHSTVPHFLNFSTVSKHGRKRTSRQRSPSCWLTNACAAPCATPQAGRGTCPHAAANPHRLLPLVTQHANSSFLCWCCD